MIVGESEFIQLNIPMYEDFRDRVMLTTDNPSVATVVGTSRTALITAHGPGNAIIRIYSPQGQRMSIQAGHGKSR